MKSSGQVARLGSLAVFGLAAAEVILMMTPFAGFFYATLQFEPVLAWLAEGPRTACLAVAGWGGAFPGSRQLLF